MKKSEAKSRIEQLSAELKRHNHNYYVLNSPEITDFQYDLLMLELQELEKMFPEFASNDSPTVNVGSDLSAKEQFEQLYVRGEAKGNRNLERVRQFDLNGE